MTVSQKWVEIEEEFTWRIDELRFLKNQISFLTLEKDKEIQRRSVLLMMYAHFEGFFKFSFQLYVRTINESSLKCHQVNSHILASAFNDLFKELRNPNSKSQLFNKALPDDRKLHTLARSVEFINSLQNSLNETVAIPEDVVNTESNLKPVVLKKILYMLGMDHTMFKDEQGDIQRLLVKRNQIAHGESRMGILAKEFGVLYDLTISLLKVIKSRIMKSLTDEDYLK